MAVIDELYLTALSRHPLSTDTIVSESVNPKTKAKTKRVTNEKAFLAAQIELLKKTEPFTKDQNGTYRAFFEDVFWALLNTNEFILNH